METFDLKHSDSLPHPTEGKVSEWLCVVVSCVPGVAHITVEEILI